MWPANGRIQVQVEEKGNATKNKTEQGKPKLNHKTRTEYEDMASGKGEKRKEEESAKKEKY